MFPQPTVELHSSQVDNDWSATPPPPTLMLRCDSRTHITTLQSAAGIEKKWADPLTALQWMSDFSAAKIESARWIGYLSYDLGRLFESLPPQAKDDLQLPLFVFTLHENASNLSLSLPWYPGGGPGWGSPPSHSSHPSNPSHLSALSEPAPSPSRWSKGSNLSRPDYIRRVQKVIDYIAAGDVFQVNLSHRLTRELSKSPQKIWDDLKERYPAAYGAYLDYGDHSLISNSPELFLKVENRKVITRPIKGTRPRKPGMEAQLRNSIKDQAELNMIVDLERNDLGRVCKIGTVKVTQPRTIEPHPTVFHGVATVEGTLRDEINFVDLLRATFPGGSITGAPKIRAMEIIDELEPTRRGPYCGAIGILRPNTNLQFSIAIRTMILKEGNAHIPVGGGIVADSDPQAEYEETLTKAKAMLDVLDLLRT